MHGLRFYKYWENSIYFTSELYLQSHNHATAVKYLIFHLNLTTIRMHWLEKVTWKKKCRSFEFFFFFRNSRHPTCIVFCVHLFNKTQKYILTIQMKVRCLARSLDVWFFFPSYKQLFWTRCMSYTFPIALGKNKSTYLLKLR